MPQMSPMWWLNMMLIFVFCLMIMNSLVYFNFSGTSYKSLKLNSKIHNWKW